MALGIGLAQCERWSWWIALLLWPVQFLMLILFIDVMISGVISGMDRELGIYSIMDIAVAVAQFIALAAAFGTLLLPSIRAEFVAVPTKWPVLNGFLYLLVTCGAVATAPRGGGIERAGAIAYAIPGEPPAQEAAPAPEGVIWDGAVVDLAVPSAAAYRVARHAFAAEAVIWHGIEILEAGIAGVVSRDEAVRDASSAVLLARREIAATFVAVEDLGAQGYVAHLSAGDLEDVQASVERWAEALERAASLAALTAPLITASEVGRGNAAYGLVPMMVNVHVARVPAIEHLGRLIPQTMLDGALFLHFAAVSDALGEVTALLPAFVDRRGASADLEATAERLWTRAIPRLSMTHPGVRALAASFQEHETEIRSGIGVPLMEDAFVPVVANYEATGELALGPTNAFLTLRSRMPYSALANARGGPARQAAGDDDRPAATIGRASPGRRGQTSRAQREPDGAFSGRRGQSRGVARPMSKPARARTGRPPRTSIRNARGTHEPSTI